MQELPEVSTSLGQKRNPGPGLHYRHADAIPGRDVRLTQLLNGATGIIAARRAWVEGVFTQGRFRHYNQDIKVCKGISLHYLYPTSGQRCHVAQEQLQGEETGVTEEVSRPFPLSLDHTRAP